MRMISCVSSLPSHERVLPSLLTKLWPTLQHNFCARLDMSVDGHKNLVQEVDIVPVPMDSHSNRYSNAFRAKHTPLRTEKQAQRDAAPHVARSWCIQNRQSCNPVNGKPVAYRLLPQTRGPSHPALLTGAESAVTARGAFATKALWVTAHNDAER